LARNLSRGTLSSAAGVDEEEVRPEGFPGLERPGDGWTATKRKRRLLHISELPAWYEPGSIFIKSGYREPGISLCECAGTACEIHNETGNIWTHFLGGVAWVALSSRALSSPDLWTRSDAKTFWLHAVCYALCGLMPLLSSLAHTFHCVGPAWYTLCWDADHLGILALWLARALSEGKLAMACLGGGGPWLAWSCATCLAVFPLAAWALLTRRASAGQVFPPLYAYIHLPLAALAASEARTLWPPPQAAAAALGAPFDLSGGGGLRGQSSSGGESALHPAADPAVDLGSLLRRGLGLTLLGSACGVAGFAVMSFKVPERWVPAAGSGHKLAGLVDTWGHSHQWWHVLTMVGPCLCLEGGRLLLRARLDFTCPA